MKKLETYGSLFAAMLSVFMIGTYADAIMYGGREVEPHQWFFTSIVGILFLSYFISRIKERQTLTKH